MTDFEHVLNPEQRAAATASDGPVLVLAAAGTGKTRTLVYRVAHLVAKGVRPDRILLLTFTNRASKEMLVRAHAVVDGDVSGVWGGTFHHMANRILRRYAGLIGYTPDYSILDRDDQKQLVTEAAKQLGLHGPDFPKSGVLLALFSSAANVEGSVLELATKQLSDTDIDPSDVLRVHVAYAARKGSLNSMDFDDLLVNSLRLLKEREDLARKYQEHFEHVLVDEYQDTNTLQAQIVDLIAAGKRNLLVVGDDFQCIYSWRGADFRHILSFPERYPDAQVFKLETNYRSVPEILAVANASIADNPEQFPKTLRATRPPYRQPLVASMRDGDAQARFVSEQVRLFRRDGYRLSDIVVLYRAHYQALELERLLPRAGIPYVITSGVRFFEQAHIKDVCALLRLLNSSNDEMAFKRLLCLLPGTGIKTASKIWQRLGQQFRPGDNEQADTLLSSLPAKSRPGWRRIQDMLADGTEITVASDGGQMMQSFTDAFYLDYAVKTYEDHERRLEDIDALVRDFARYSSIPQFLADVALLTNVDNQPTAIVDSDAALKLSTIHQAKGLEWRVVIILWAVEGMLPLARAMAEEGGIAEERRLFYVAVTRAADELVICVPQVRRGRDGMPLDCEPSRFVAAIPRDTVRMTYVDPT